MKIIPLTRGQVTKVSDEWFDYLNQWKWYALWNSSTKSFYAARKDNKNLIRMSRVIANTPDSLMADHINHDTLDNQVENLRNVTHSQNMMNKKSYSSNKLGVKNIRRKDSGFEVRIKKDGKFVFDKWFSNLDMAIIARDSAIKEFYGEYGHIPQSK